MAKRILAEDVKTAVIELIRKLSIGNPNNIVYAVVLQKPEKAPTNCYVSLSLWRNCSEKSPRKMIDFESRHYNITTEKLQKEIQKVIEQNYPNAKFIQS